MHPRIGRLVAAAAGAGSARRRADRPVDRGLLQQPARLFLERVDRIDAVPGHMVRRDRGDGFDDRLVRRRGSRGSCRRERSRSALWRRAGSRPRRWWRSSRRGAAGARRAHASCRRAPCRGQTPARRTPSRRGRRAARSARRRGSSAPLRAGGRWPARRDRRRRRATNNHGRSARHDADDGAVAHRQIGARSSRTFAAAWSRNSARTSAHAMRNATPPNWIDWLPAV